MRLHFFVTTLAVAIMNFGCATILQPGPDKIRVNSNPEGAKVYLDEELVGVTPLTVSVPRASEGVFRIEKDGYEPITIDRDKVASGWVFGNLLLGGLVGGTVDLITHSQGHYQETPIYSELPARGPASARADSVK